MKKLFGTDGVRGTANIYPMTAEIALSLGRAIAHIYKGERGPHRIVVGKDTRLSGYMLETAMTAGICSMGADVLLVGPLPTPAIAFITHTMRADAGVVISASHNPFQDNGIKFFDASGFKLDDKIEMEIEKLVFTNGIESLRPTADDIGKAYRIDDASGRYIEFLKRSFPSEHTLDGLRIVLDCANGAAYSIAPIVLEELGAEVIPLNVEPDGSNINAHAGCLEPELLAAEVKKHNAHIGIALDGDADRAVFADEKGQVLPGDAAIAICALRLQKFGRLKKNTVVATQMSNIGLEQSLKSAGINVVRCQVGDRYVLETIRREGYSFGGESSGHMIFFDTSTTGDGMVAALQILAAMVHEQQSLSELAKVYSPAPQVCRNVPVREKPKLEEVKDVAAAISRAESALGNDGRLLVRYSGTEPLARVMVEGPDTSIIEGFADDIAEAIQKNIG